MAPRGVRLNHIDWLRGLAVVIMIEAHTVDAWVVSDALVRDQPRYKMLQFLATHPQPIQGVWNGALMGVAAGQAFEQVGRPLPKINGFSGSCSFLAYWKEKRLESFGGSQSGSTALYTAVDVAYRMLKGQKPAVNTILTPLPEVTQANFGDWYKPSMTVQDSCFADPPDGRRVSEDDLGRYFTNGATPSPALQP